MAGITVSENRNAFATLANGVTLPIKGGWTYMAVPEGLVRWADDEELWITIWDDEVAGFNVTDLKDGETWRLGDTTLTRQGNVYSYSGDGSVWTRHGDELVVWTPAQLAKAA